MKRTSLLLSVALILGGLVVTYFYQERFRFERSGGPPIEVVVAAQAIPFGEPVRAEWLATRALPETFVEERHVPASQIRDLIGVPLAQSVRAGEAIMRSDLSVLSSQRRTLSAEIPSGHRAITILATTASVFNGLLRPGDHVDVILTVGDPLRPAGWRSVLLFQNVAVIAIGHRIQEEETDEGQRGYRLGQATSVTLLVTLAQGAHIAQALQDGRLQLLLRNGSDVGTREAPLELAVADILDPERRSRYVYRDARRPRLLHEQIEVTNEPSPSPSPSIDRLQPLGAAAVGAVP